MAISHYTTTVDVFKTIAEVEKILMHYGAKSIVKNYENNSVSSLAFMIDSDNGPLPIKLPIKVNECLKVMERDKQNGTKAIKATYEQAERVAWRILKDWLQATLDLLDIDMVSLEEIFLSYIVDKSGTTLYERLKLNNFYIEDHVQ